MTPGYEKRAKARALQNERRLMGETLEAFHRREHARPPTLAEIFENNRRNRERCALTVDLFPDNGWACLGAARHGSATPGEGPYGREI